MKPGMQRDILVAYWLLFDEFGIGESDPPQDGSEGSGTPSRDEERPPVQQPPETRRRNR